ncbi:MAG: transposase [Phycisphaerae bacterium]|nr:transposase [Phycisphaerae bacterium]
MSALARYYLWRARGISKPRGNLKNRIKEQQLMLFADRASCHSFVANQLRLLLSSAACALVKTPRRTALASWCTIRNRQSRSTREKRGRCVRARSRARPQRIGPFHSTSQEIWRLTALEGESTLAAERKGTRAACSMPDCTASVLILFLEAPGDRRIGLVSPSFLDYRHRGLYFLRLAKEHDHLGFIARLLIASHLEALIPERFLIKLGELLDRGRHSDAQLEYFAAVRRGHVGAVLHLGAAYDRKREAVRNIAVANTDRPLVRLNPGRVSFRLDGGLALVRLYGDLLSLDLDRSSARLHGRLLLRPAASHDGQEHEYE